MTCPRQGPEERELASAAEDGPAVELPIDGVLDLHTFAPRDVADVTEAYLEEAHARGIRWVRIIHGRGIGVQRRTVRRVLERRGDLVSGYRDAEARDGGWGATIARMQPTGSGGGGSRGAG